MKASLNKLAAELMALGLAVGAGVSSQAQITVKVDSSKNWVGYVNWYSTNNTYVGGGTWGFADLRARFAPSKANATHLILQINTNMSTVLDGYWNLPDGTPNKHLEANSYVDVGTAFAGNDVTFEGHVQSNSIPVGWTCEAVIKHFNGSYANFGGISRTPLIEGTPFSVTRTIPPGGICQYGFILYGPNTPVNSANSLQAVSIVVETPNPAIVTEPTDARAVLGGTATFTVAAAGNPSPAFYWKRYGTNLVDGVKFSGVHTPTVTIHNVTADDAATNYTVLISNVLNSVSSRLATLKVLAAAEFANALDNPSFEEDYVEFGVVPKPWINFSGSALWSTTEFSASTPPDGTNVVQVYNSGEWNGIYQDVPAAPGDIFTGECRLYQWGIDPLSAPTNVAYLEVQFRQGNAAPIATYSSIFITNSPAFVDAWLLLQATNGVAAGYSTTSTSNATYLVAPPGTDHVRYQITLHAVGAGNGSIFVDDMRLMKKIPVTVTSSLGSSDITLTWLSQGATDYQVVYKDNLDSPEWTPIGAVVPGDGTVKSATFQRSTDRRFYRVLTK